MFSDYTLQSQNQNLFNMVFPPFCDWEVGHVCAKISCHIICEATDGRLFYVQQYFLFAGEGTGLLRLHSTYRHDLKIYSSDEGRVQASFIKLICLTLTFLFVRLFLLVFRFAYMSTVHKHFN